MCDTWAIEQGMGMWQAGNCYLDMHELPTARVSLGFRVVYTKGVLVTCKM